MNKTAIIYWSGTGNTEAMAKAILEGALSAGSDRTEMSLCSVSEITPEEAAAFDKLALGCPSMGAETLEESEFEPFFTALEDSLSGKRVALFGSYGWGDGQWMRDWIQRVEDAGADLYDKDGLMVNETPDDTGLELCRDLGKGLVTC